MCHEHFEMDFWYGCYQQSCLYPLHACNGCCNCNDGLLHGWLCVTQSQSCRAFTVSAVILQLQHDLCAAAMSWLVYIMQHTCSTQCLGALEALPKHMHCCSTSQPVQSAHCDCNCLGLNMPVCLIFCPTCHCVPCLQSPHQLCVCLQSPHQLCVWHQRQRQERSAASHTAGFGCQSFCHQQSQHSEGVHQEGSA